MDVGRFGEPKGRYCRRGLALIRYSGMNEGMRLACCTCCVDGNVAAGGRILDICSWLKSSYFGELSGPSDFSLRGTVAHTMIK